MRIMAARAGHLSFAVGHVRRALQLGAPLSVECVSQVNQSRITFPDRALIRLDFPARGGMPPVKVFYHDSARPDEADAYHVPGMENETILPPANNLGEKGRPSSVYLLPKCTRCCPRGEAR